MAIAPEAKPRTTTEVELAKLFNPEAERAVIGCLLNDNTLIERLEFLRSEHLYEPMGQRTFAKLRNMHEKGFAATRDTLLRELITEDNAESLESYLYNCYMFSITAMHPERLALLIIDLWMKRQLVSVSKQTIDEAYIDRTDDTASQLIESAEYRLFQLASGEDHKRDFVGFDKLTKEAIELIEMNYKHKKQLIGATTGLIDLDRMLGGLQKSDLVIIAGRPSMGKTALAINIAVNTCRGLKEEGKSVGFFSLEMSSEQLTNRIISMHTGVNSFKLRSGNITQGEYDSVVRCYKHTLHDMDLFIDDTPGLSVSNLRTRARKLARRHKLGVLFIDYLQLVRDTSASSQANKVQEISAITQALKNLAKELNIPVVALSQLSRAVEQREDKRPLLSDLRESGSIEQDADVVMFIYREEYYTRRSQPKAGTPEHEKWQGTMDNIMNQAEIIIAKQRNGPVGNVKLYFDSNTTVFKDAA